MNLGEQLKRDGHLLRRPEKSGPKPKRFLKRTVRPRQVSSKRSAERAIYKRMLPGWIEAHPVCEIGPVFHAAGIMVKCNRVTRHPHHVRGRIGKLLYDATHFKASCDGECHPWAVHFGHPKEARELGLIQG